MNKHPFSYIIWKLSLKNSWWLVAILTALVLSLFLTGCINSTIEPETENYPGELNQLQTPSLFQATPSITPLPGTPTLTGTSATVPVLTSTSAPQATPSSISNTPAPAQTPTSTPSLTPTPVSLPELLIAAIEVKQKGEADEFHEIWMVNTLTGDKQLIFTTTPGTSLTQMMWGDEQSDILYVAEIKGLGGEDITWQLYEINYETGSSRAFFEEPVEGLPTLLDISAQGKWLRVRVDYFDPISLEWWFVNTEDGTVMKNDPDDPYLSGFVWSPDEPDVFAYFQEATLKGDRQVPQSIIISEVTNFEVLDAIKYQYTNFKSQPMLMWYLPEQIMFLTPDETHIVDLTQRQWEQIAQGLDVFPGDGYTQLLKSPSGQWAVTTTFIKVIQLNDTPKVVERFDDRIGWRHEFLSWYNDKDWIVISTQGSKVQIYELGGSFDLIREISLNDYGIASPGWSAVLAKPLE